MGTFTSTMNVNTLIVLILGIEINLIIAGPDRHRINKDRRKDRKCKDLEQENKESSWFLDWMTGTKKMRDCGMQDASFGPSSDRPEKIPFNLGRSLGFKKASAPMNTKLFSNRGQLDNNYKLKNNFDRDM